MRVGKEQTKNKEVEQKQGGRMLTKRGGKDINLYRAVKA